MLGSEEVEVVAYRVIIYPRRLKVVDPVVDIQLLCLLRLLNIHEEEEVSVTKALVVTVRVVLLQSNNINKKVDQNLRNEINRYRTFVHALFASLVRGVSIGRIR